VKAWVVDASVAAKWFPPLDREPLASEAHAVLNRWIQGEIDLLAPDLIWIEIANILWRSVRQNRCSLREADSVLALMHEQGLPTVPAQALLDSAFRIAVRHGRAAYDNLYVALAVDRDSQLVTADEKLANALAGHLPVKWLGAL
jgi:predicted nucleic acid-binding protein